MQKTINILFLDDMEERISMFSNLFLENRSLFGEAGFDLRGVATADAALQALTEKHWDVVCLDHDLGGQVFVESGKGTGYEVAQYIGQQHEYNDQTIFIHSWNPDGAKKMCNELLNFAYIPFSQQYCKIVLDFAIGMV